MIREGRQLPDDVMKRVPQIVEKMSQDEEVTALYAFGSLAKDVKAFEKCSILSKVKEGEDFSHHRGTCFAFHMAGRNTQIEYFESPSGG